MHFFDIEDAGTEAKAVEYLEIMSLGLFTMFALMQVTAVLRAGGNARMPMFLMIGANALITENKVIPDGSLVMGMPGKVVRNLTEDQQAANLKTAAHYQRRMRAFRRDLTELD